MMNTHRPLRLRLALATLTLALASGMPTRAADADPIAQYRHNVLACLNVTTRATCIIWFGNVWKEGDNGYVVMWDRGPQAELPTVGGNFRMEGRDGKLSFRKGQVCLKPNPARGAKFFTDKDGELYAGAGCYELAAHAPGEQWTQRDAKGREVKFWLLPGR